MEPKTLKYVEESSDPYMAVCCVLVFVCFFVIVVFVYTLSYNACSVCLRMSGVMRLFEFYW